MNTVKTWSDERLLRLNIDKCKAVSYYLKYPPLDTQYHTVDGNTIYILEKLNSVNDLGVIFDSNLTLKDHMAQKINKASWVSLKEILYTWTSLVLYCYINQWSDHIWNMRIQCGVHINKGISKS